jgi:hypothetical protein
VVERTIDNVDGLLSEAGADSQMHEHDSLNLMGGFGIPRYEVFVRNSVSDSPSAIKIGQPI